MICQSPNAEDSRTLMTSVAWYKQSRSKRSRAPWRQIWQKSQNIAGDGGWSRARQKQCQFVFHPHNKSHDRELNVSLNGQRLTRDPHPVYLGVTLDRTLSYNDVFAHPPAQLRSRKPLWLDLTTSDIKWGGKKFGIRQSWPTMHSGIRPNCLATGLRITPPHMVIAELLPYKHRVVCSQSAQVVPDLFRQVPMWWAADKLRQNYWSTS